MAGYAPRSREHRVRVLCLEYKHMDSFYLCNPLATTSQENKIEDLMIIPKVFRTCKTTKMSVFARGFVFVNYDIDSIFLCNHLATTYEKNKIEDLMIIPKVLRTCKSTKISVFARGFVFVNNVEK